MYNPLPFYGDNKLFEQDLNANWQGRDSAPP